MSFSTNLLVFVASSVTLLVACQSSEMDKRYQEGLGYVGTINGKTFLVPFNNTRMNWFSARGLCESFGVELANFRNPDEFQFVYENVDRLVNGDLWIDGSAQTGSAFIKTDGSQMEITSLHFWPNHWICVYFSGDHHTYTDFCIEGQHKPLCQIVNTANSLE